jgi:hypothetical protein
MRNGERTRKVAEGRRAARSVVLYVTLVFGGVILRPDDRALVGLAAVSSDVRAACAALTKLPRRW